MRKEIIADTASSRMTNKKDTNDSKSSIFFIAMSMHEKNMTQFLPIFLLSDECLLFEKQKFFKNDVRS